ncbi:MAG TPA: glycosyltransferase family A protein [Thermoanaerobaculia bacterium]|jgi:hypothetical protein
MDRSSMPSSVPAAATPLVSVVLPVYDGERYLRESLDSILAQRYPRIEGARPLASAAARRALGRVAPRRLLASRHVQRARLTAVYLGFLLLARLPRLAPVAELLRRRWYPGSP